MKKYLLIGGIVLLGGLSLFMIQKNDSHQTENENNTAKEMVEESMMQKESVEKRQNAEDIAEESSYANVTQQAALEAVGTYSGTGTATRAFNGERFFHTVTANITDPAEGKFYEGWLVDGSNFFSTGKMMKKDDGYYLEYFDDVDQSTYDLVVITEETLADGLDNKPEAHVLEGSF